MKNEKICHRDTEKHGEKTILTTPTGLILYEYTKNTNSLQRTSSETG